MEVVPLRSGTALGHRGFHPFSRYTKNQVSGETHAKHTLFPLYRFFTHNFRIFRSLPRLLGVGSRWFACWICNMENTRALRPVFLVGDGITSSTFYQIFTLIWTAHTVQFNIHIQKRKKSNVAKAWYETSPLLIGHTGLVHPSQRIHRAGMALQRA